MYFEVHSTLLFQAKVDEGGKCLQVSREENVCEYL